jgi:methyl-accepting chemotaxis protein
MSSQEIREVLEAVRTNLLTQSESIAQLADGLSEAAAATTEISAEVVSLREAIVDMSRELNQLSGLVGNFVRETERLRSEVREKLRVGNG